MMEHHKQVNSFPTAHAHYCAYACNRRNRVVRGLETPRALGRETCYVRAETVPECELNPARSSGLVSEEPLFSFSTEERATVGWKKVSVV